MNATARRAIVWGDIPAIRYTIAMFQNRSLALDFLDEMFGAGEVSTIEEPRVERRGAGYAVTLKG